MIIYLDRAEVPDLEHIPGQVLQHLISASEQANGRYDSSIGIIWGDMTTPKSSQMRARAL